MAQHDYVIANQGFPAFRSDLNNGLAAIVSNNSGATEPTTMFAHMIWLDTAAAPSILKIRNADNDAWITIGTINQTADTFTLTAPVATTTITTSSTINNLTVGRGAGSVSTNTAVGASALAANTTGANNVAVGYQALDENETGVENTAVGSSALSVATTARNNVAVGFRAGVDITTGTFNTCVGPQDAGDNLTTGGFNTYVGFLTNASSGGVSGSITIGAGNIGVQDKGSSTGFINPNNGGVYQGDNSSTWSTTSDERLKKNIVDNTDGLDKINAIRVRNFEYRTEDEITELDPSNVINVQGTQLGVIAQEIQQVCPQAVKEESTGVLSVNTDNLIWYLVNAVKELKAEIDKLKGQ